MICEKIRINLNSKGESVKELQQYLKACKFYTGRIDGICGEYMVEAIKLFQKNHKILMDGVWGPDTCKSSDIKKSTNSKDLSSPSKNINIKDIKELGIIFKKQPDIISCVPTSLSMCYSHYKKEYSISYLKKLCNTNTNGTSPQDLINATKKVNSNYRLFEEEYGGFKQIKKIY